MVGVYQCHCGALLAADGSGPAHQCKPRQTPSDQTAHGAVKVDEAMLKQMDEQADDNTPSSIQRDKGLVWLEGWFDLAAALRAPVERKGEGKAIYIWFADNGNIRKWSFEPFENGRCYLPRYEPTWENPDGPTAA